MKRRKEVVLLGVLLLMAAAPRLLLQLAAPTFYFDDAPGYLEPAISLIHGEGFPLRLKRPPGYPLVLGAALLTDGGLAAVTALQHLVGLATVTLTYILGRRWFGRAVGAGAALLVSLSSQQLTLEHTVMTESLSTFLLVLLLYAASVAVERPSGRLALGLGLLVGAATLTRPVGVLLAPIALAAAWLPCASRTARLRRLACVALGVALLLLPNALRNQLEHGRFSASGSLGESLLARTIQYGRGGYRFDGPDLAPDPDPVRASARVLIQQGMERRQTPGEVRDRLRAELGLTEEQADRLLQGLATETILRDPVQFVAETPPFLVRLFSDPERSTAALYNLSATWERTPLFAPLVRQAPADPAAARPTVELALRLFRPSRLKLLLPALALLGAVLVARGGRTPRRAAILLGAATVGCLALAQVVVDGPVVRYRAPLDPIVGVLALGGVALAASAALRFQAQARPFRATALDLAGLVVGLALVVRLWDLHVYDPSSFGSQYDEGVRMGQLYLMAEGFRPFRDIYASQGPLLLDYFYPFYALFGGSVWAARLGAIAAAAVSLAGVGLVARAAGGPLAAVLAVFIAAVSPLHLQHSRLALAELPSLAPCLLGVWLAWRYRQTRRPLDLHLSAALFALGVVLKPMAAVNGVPIVLLLAWRPDRRALRDLAEWGVTGAIVVLGALVAVGPNTLVDQFVTYRVQAAGLGPMGRAAWSVEANAAQVYREFQFDLPWLLVGGLGLLPLWRRDRLAAVVLLAWVVAAAAMLVFYSPLSEKHVLYLLPPSVFLAAAGLAVAREHLGMRGKISVLARASLALGLAWLLAGSPIILAADRDVLEVETSTLAPDGDMAETLRIIAAVSRPSDYLVTDLPWLSWLARRRQPPRLADVSDTRIRSRSLTDAEMIAEMTQHRPAVVVYWASRMQRLIGFGAWLADDYVLTRMFDHNRAVFVRRDLLDRVPPTDWWRTPTAGGARFGAALKLEATRPDTARGEQSPRLELAWRALDDVREQHVVRIDVRARDTGESVWHRDDRLLPPWHRLPWPAGSTVSQRRELDVGSLPDGEYVLTVSVRPSHSASQLRAEWLGGGFRVVNEARTAVQIGELKR